mmetsp:Transcript_69948/g.152612  ORF Transcript_69948/g.152612 Transcript_69948/m.152612 type:complete len:334 (-) Transcript_69948:434-1435(-)
MIAGVRSERMGGGFLLAAGDVGALLQAGTAVQVFQQVEQGLLLAFIGNSGVLAPLQDGLLWNAQSHHGLAIEVRLDGNAQPVGSLSQGLEGTGRGMEAIVAGVGLAGQVKVLPLLEDRMSQRRFVSSLRVGASQHLTAEVAPSQVAGVPLHLVIVDALAGHRELRSHPSIEAVDDEDLSDFATIETTAELDEVLALLQGVVLVAKLVHGASQLLGAVHQIVDDAGRQSLLPRLSEGLLEGFLGLGLDSQFIRLLLHGTRSDGAVVSVDEHVLVNLFGSDSPLGPNADSLQREALLHQSLDLVGHGMWLDEDEGRMQVLSGEDLEFLDPLVQGS